MREFFQGWKRKVGVVTLGLACALAVGWIRSFQLDEMVGFNWFDRRHVVRSIKGNLIWYSCDLSLSERQSFSLSARWSSDPISRKWSGKTASIYAIGGGHFHRDSGAYWGIVPSLTLLSAWLLLSKPCVAKRTHVLQPKA